jgi:hypothetical protein
LTNYSPLAAYIPARESGYAPAGWKMVLPRNQNFVGRDDMLGRTRSMLVNSTQTAVLLPRALYGLGGVGKTQLAIEYVHRHRSDNDLIWWAPLFVFTESQRYDDVGNWCSLSTAGRLSVRPQVSASTCA